MSSAEASKKTVEPHVDGVEHALPAWTRRDELAAIFMQGMLAGNPALEAGSSSGSLQNQGAAMQVGLRAYRFADGFLAARTVPARQA